MSLSSSFLWGTVVSVPHPSPGRTSGSGNWSEGFPGWLQERDRGPLRLGERKGLVPSICPDIKKLEGQARELLWWKNFLPPQPPSCSPTPEGSVLAL